jgi:Restriction endonuclease ThaI
MSASPNSSNSPLFSLFEDSNTVEKIKNRLPHLFWLAKIDSSRAGKAGMQIGSAREAIIIALLIYKFGEQNVRTDIPITEPEVDVIVNNHPISIKTIAAKTIGSGVKAIWTVDAQKAREFVANYKPKCDRAFLYFGCNT